MTSKKPPKWAQVTAVVIFLCFLAFAWIAFTMGSIYVLDLIGFLDWLDCTDPASAPPHLECEK